MWNGIAEIRHTTHSMSFYVSLIHQVDAILVTKVIPKRVIRIVRTSHGIDIETLQESEVVHHDILGCHMSQRVVGLMSVHTFYIYYLTIHHQTAILYLDLTEAHIRLDGVLAVYQLALIEIRLFCTPQLHLLNRLGKRQVLIFPLTFHCLAFLIYHLTISIKQLQKKRTIGRSLAKVSQNNISLEVSIAILVYRSSLDGIIPDATLLISLKIHFTLNTCDTPKVLVFHITTVVIAIHLYCQIIITRHEIWGNIKLRRSLAALGHAHFLAIDINSCITRNGAKVKHHLPIFPVVRNGKGCAISSNRIRNINIRRIRSPIILEINKYGCPETLQFPVGRHRNLCPFGIIIMRKVEVGGCLFNVVIITETPHTVQGLDIRSLEPGVRFFLTSFKHRWILPFIIS